MRIIIAPAKKMRKDIDYLEAKQLPIFLKETKKLSKVMKAKTIDELKQTLGCSERIAKEAASLFKEMKLDQGVVPALLAYDGIQYTYMAPSIFLDEYYAYVEEHLRILSGFYGILKPFDGVVPYRLELNNPFDTSFCASLYAFWNQRLYQELTKDDPEILDLASAQYSKIITPYLTKRNTYVKCYFMEEEQGRLREKGVYVKMARGEMVRYLAEINAQSFEEVKGFQRLQYQFQEALSDEHRYVFVRKKQKEGKKDALFDSK